MDKNYITEFPSIDRTDFGVLKSQKKYVPAESSKHTIEMFINAFEDLFLSDPKEKYGIRMSELPHLREYFIGREQDGKMVDVAALSINTKSPELKASVSYIFGKQRKDFNLEDSVEESASKLMQYLANPSSVNPPKKKPSRKLIAGEEELEQ